MVEYSSQFDSIFYALSDPTRRDILKRVSVREFSISELGAAYAMSFAAVAKHVGVLEKARLVCKNRRGKRKIIQLSMKTLESALDHLSEYEKLWDTRFDQLDSLLTNP